MTSLPKFSFRALAVAALISVTTSHGLAQAPDTGDVNQRLAVLERALGDLQQQVGQLANALHPANDSPVHTAAPFDLSIEGAPAKGAEDAHIIVVEFADFQCPFCARHA